MATLQDLIKGFEAADARAQQGDQQAATDARAFAQAIQQMQSAPAPAPQPAAAPQPAPAPGSFAELQAQAGQPKPQGGSIADPLAQGLTFGFADELTGALGAGVNSIANLFGAGTGEGFTGAYRGIRDAARQNQAAFSARNPATALAAEVGTGLLSGGAGLRAVGAGIQGARNLGRTAAIGAGEGALFGAGASEADTVGGVAQDVGQGALLGGGLAGLTPAVGAAARRTRSRTPRVDSQQSRNINILENAGVPLTAGQRSGREAVQQLETTLSDVPLAGGPLADVLGKQRQKFQSKVLDFAGFAQQDIKEGLLSPEGFERARDRFSQRYADALSGVDVRLGDTFNQSLDEVKELYTSRLGGGRNRKFSNIIEDVRDRAGSGILSGQEYQKLRSEIGKFERSAQPDTASLYTDVKRKLDEAFFDAAGETTARAKKQIDNDYGAFKILEDLNRRSAGGAAGTASGNIPLGMLARAAQQKPGSKEFKDFTRAGQAILTDTVPSSGTAQRLLTQGGIFGAGAAAVNPAVLAPVLAGGLLGRGVASGLANPQAVGQAAQGIGRGATNLGLLSAGPAAAQLSSQPQLPPTSPQDPRFGQLPRPIR